jgi:dienelactone hydrolase
MPTTRDTGRDFASDCAFDFAFSVRKLAILLAALQLMPVAWAALSHKEAASLREKIRSALFIPQPLPALNIKNYGSFSPLPDVVVEKVTYASEYGMRIPANVFRPRQPVGKLPAMVVVAGHAGDKSTWYSYYTGMMYAEAGVIVLTYDPIGEGERNDDHKSGTSEHDREIDADSMPARMGGLMVTDVMQAVSYLSQRKDVDQHRIAVLGFSMGSFIAALEGAADPRVDVLLLTGGGDLDGVGGYWATSPRTMCQSGPYNALAFLGDRPAVLYALRAQSGPTFIINGLADSVVDIPHHGPQFFAELRQRVIDLNGSSHNVFETMFLPGVSHRPNWLMKPAALWLDRQLQFANWHGATLQAHPTIDIGDWARQVEQPLSKSSLRLDRDAGIAALAANVPLLTQSQLDVLHQAQWEQLRENFIYSAWVEHALAQAEH